MSDFDPRRLPPDWEAGDTALLQAIDDATATPVYIDYRLGPEWAEGVHAMIDELESAAVRAPIALELTEHALMRILHAQIDDSDGWTVGFCERLLPLHAEAAAAAGVDATALAELRRFRGLDPNPFDELR